MKGNPVMRIGYMRISTHDQKLDLQEDALKQAGCDKIFSDTASGAKEDRIGLAEALEYLRQGDVLVVWRLDRLARSMKQLVQIVTDLREKGIGFICLQEGIDTETSSGQLVFGIFASLAAFERELIRERTRAGLKAARARGKCGGRPKALTSKQAELAKILYADPNVSVSDICRQLGIGRTTLYRAVKAA